LTGIKLITDNTHDNAADDADDSVDDGTKRKSLQSAASASAVFKYQYLNTTKKLAAFWKDLEKQKTCTINLETSGTDPLTAKIIGWSFSWRPGEAYFLPHQTTHLKNLRPYLESERFKKSGYNLKFAWRLLKNLGLKPAGLDFDVLIAAYVLNPGDRRLDLDALAFTELGLERRAGGGSG
jgi:DNA polymerase-1